MERRRMIRRRAEGGYIEGERPVEFDEPYTEPGERRSGVDRRRAGTIEL